MNVEDKKGAVIHCLPGGNATKQEKSVNIWASV